MKRPLAVIGFSYLAALRVAFIFGIQYAAALSCVFAAAGICTLAVKRLRCGGAAPAAFFGAAAAMVVLTLYSAAYVVPGEAYCGKTGNVTAVLTELPYQQNGRYYYKIKIASTDIRGGRAGTSAVISSKNSLDIEPFDTLEAHMSFYERPTDSYYNYGVSRGMQLHGRINEKYPVTVTAAEKQEPMYYVLKLKERLISEIHSLMPEREAAIVSAMLLSDRFSIDSTDTAAFRAAGVSHIIVVSGFHLAVIVALFSALSGIFIKNKRIVSLLCCLLVFLFMALTGFSPSVVRAGIMQLAVLLAAASYRRADPLNSLGLSALIICFINPYSSADVGFLLSFYATLGIIVLSPRLQSSVSEKLQVKKDSGKPALIRIRRFLAPVGRYFLSVFCVTVSAVLFTTPCSLMNFRSFAVYSIPFNLFISPVASILICSAVIMAMLSLLPLISVLAVPFAFICRFAADYIIIISSLASLLPYSYVSAARDYIPACLLLSVGLTVILLFLFRDKKRMLRLSAALTAFLFLFAAVTSGISELGSHKVSVVDVGDGLSVVLRKSNGNAAVLFCGGEYGDYYMLRDYLDLSGIDEISYLLIADLSSADSGYAARLLQEKKISAVHVYDRERFSERLGAYLDDTAEVINSSYRDERNAEILFGDTKITVIRRFGCTAVSFGVEGCSFLIIGDRTDCSLIPEEYRQCDYLIINGTAANTKLISAGTVIISDSPENKDADLGSLYAQCSECCMTGGSGSICVRINGGSSSLRRENSWLS